MIVPFLGSWFQGCEGYVLICDKVHRFRGRFYRLDPSDPPEFVLPDNQNRSDVYFSVCTFKTELRAAWNVKQVPGFWVDMDFKDYPGGRVQAVELLQAFPLIPSCIVNSGHGLHVYWKFTQPVEPQPQISRILKAVQKSLGGDSCSDFARLLRVPGTLNCKFSHIPHDTGSHPSMEVQVVEPEELFGRRL